jgi:hypothetical protein
LLEAVLHFLLGLVLRHLAKYLPEREAERVGKAPREVGHKLRPLK